MSDWAVTQVNGNTVAFAARYVASARQLGLGVEEGLNALFEITSPGNTGANWAQTLDRSQVEVAQALSAAPAAAGIANMVAANSRA